MTMKRTGFFFAALFVFINSVCFLAAQEEAAKPPMAIGLYGGLNINMHSPSFDYPILSDPPLIDEVPFDENKNSFGGNFGVVFNYPFDEMFVLSGRLGYNMMGVELEQEITPDGWTHTETIDASLDYLEITPALQLHNLVPVDGLYLLGGLEFGVPLGAEYDLTEITSISPPVMDTISDNGRELPDAGIRFALAIGAGYTIDLGGSVYLTPEASFRFPFTTVSGSDSFDSWNAPQLRVGVSITFGLGGEEEIPEGSMLDVGFRDVRYYDKEGNKYPLKNITVEEVQYTELFPIIPYVFCSANSPFPAPAEQELAAEKEAGEFSLSMLEPDAMDINIHTLDILGERMRMNPNTKITITGTNDTKSENENEELSGKRAEFAKNYLIVNYGIGSDRIETRSTGLPEKASAVNDPDGMAENRRIEFSSEKPEILEPIIIEKERQALASPDLIEFVPYAVSTDSVERWVLEIFQADKSLRKYAGSGEPQPMKWIIMPNELSRTEIPVEYVFSAENEAGLEKTATGSVPINFISMRRKKAEDMADRTISKFSLIVFDFDKAVVSDHDRKIIEENVLPAIKYNSTVQVYGYTDRIGSESYNKNLAKRRAEAVREVLKNKVETAKYEVYGVGENNIIFDNDSPIGRQLSRTVQIYVITPK